ncbi:hypothetical protein FPV67DRAFT_509570 [Lyophyllum atratum]|nr:hypothetical protein FPV67DRAFT_509570 [Lyophyllum atratum]
MHLYLSTVSVINSTYSNENGQVIYKVDTPMALGTRTSTISYVVPNDIPQEDVDPDMRDKFDLFGQVEHKRVGSSVLRFAGHEFETKTYLRKSSEWGAHGLHHRIFTASDGLEYKWLLQRVKCKLVVNDEKQTVVATFHRQSHGLIGAARPASLDILPAGEHISQEIFMTFIYMEKMRKDRE